MLKQPRKTFLPRLPEHLNSVLKNRCNFDGAEMKLQIRSSFDVELAIDWLTDSGIQDTNGGFYAWYDTETGDYSFLYPEITGYAIQILTRLHNQTKNSSYLNKACTAGNWLLKNQKDDGSFFCKHFNTEQEYDNTFYVFDAGIISCGLMDLYKNTSEKRYLNAAIKAMDLTLEFQNPDGSFNAGRTPEGNILNSPHWSQTSSCHHTKMLLPLLRLHKLTDHQKYLDSATKLLKWSFKLQLPTGRFVTFLGSNDTYTHASCYALEGLAAASTYFDDSKNLQVSKRVGLGVNWLLDHQNSDGSVWNWNGSHKNKIKVNEALAQTIRLAHISQDKQNQSFNEHTQKGLVFFKNMQVLDTNIRTNGGICYGATENKRIQHVSACATIFAIHAALMIENGPTRQILEEMI